ncbi:unnamed protein product [Bursaphelenchus xylophilus]|nr:unnamed protein product [Bursaphelenchus xylophilus]CAG9124721.1 unnamed protein product [Bursaphelenchus xylophilus]
MKAETATQSMVKINSMAKEEMQKRSSNSRQPSRQALQRHIALLQTKRHYQSRLPLLQQILIQEEFEDKVGKLNQYFDESSDDESNASSSSSSASSSSSDSSSSESDSDDDDFGPTYTLVKRPRMSIMSSRKKSKQ